MHHTCNNIMYSNIINIINIIEYYSLQNSPDRSCFNLVYITLIERYSSKRVKFSLLEQSALLDLYFHNKKLL